MTRSPRCSPQRMATHPAPRTCAPARAAERHTDAPSVVKQLTESRPTRSALRRRYSLMYPAFF
eukprot:8615896-Lingulodinium_polyedra.AAC.1